MKQREQLRRQNGKNNRSRVTNSSRLFLGAVDGRSIEARRWRDLFHNLVAIVTRDGREELKADQELLLRRVVSMEVLAEQIEAKIVAGEEVSPDLYLRLANSQGRLFERLGLPDVVGVDDQALEDYLAKATRNKGRHKARIVSDFRE